MAGALGTPAVVGSSLVAPRVAMVANLALPSEVKKDWVVAPKDKQDDTATGPGWWVDLKRLEARYLMAPLQRLVAYDLVEPVMVWTKVATRRSAYGCYAALLMAACSTNGKPVVHNLAEISTALMISRRLNDALKKRAGQPRPYVEFPAELCFFKKKKDSHSFPSQSIQTLCIMVCAFADASFVDNAERITNVTNVFPAACALFLCFVLFSVAVCRVYRGLHYWHDIFASLLIARTLYTLVRVAFATMTMHSSMASPLVSLLFTTSETPSN